MDEPPDGDRAALTGIRIPVGQGHFCGKKRQDRTMSTGAVAYFQMSVFGFRRVEPFLPISISLVDVQTAQMFTKKVVKRRESKPIGGRPAGRSGAPAGAIPWL